MANALMTAGRRAPGPVVGPADVAIRPLRDADLLHVASLYRATYAGSDDAMTREEAEAEIVASRRGAYGVWLDDASLGAWHRGSLVGAILVTTDAPWDDVPPGPFVIDLFVRGDVRRQGLGRALVESAWSAVDASIALRVDDSAPAARALYEGLGFRAS